MKTKIIGIAMAAIMIVSIFGALAPTGIATTGDKNEITPDTQGASVIIGQVLSFSGDDEDEPIVGLSPDDVEGVTIGTATDDFDSELFSMPGTYYVDRDGDAEKDANETSLSVSELKFELKLEIDGDEVASTTEGQIIDIALSTNIPDAAQGDIKLTKVEGEKLITVDGNGDDLQNLVMDGVADPGAIRGFTLDTTDFDKGEYEIYVKTDKDDADGLSAESNVVTLTIYKEEIVLTADNEEPTIDKDVKFTVQGPPDTRITIVTDEPEISEMQTGAEKVPGGTPSWNNDGEFLLDGVDPDFKTNENGAFTFIMQFTDDKMVTITVKDNEVGIDPDIDDEVDIDVQDLEAELEVPRTVVIGEDIEVKGTSNTGDSVDIYMEGLLVAEDVDIDDGEFDEDIVTGTDADIDDLKLPGNVKVEIVVDGPGGTVGDTDIDDLDKDLYDIDDSAVVRLVSGELTAEQADDAITTEDEDYTILGTAEGMTDVDVIIFGPKGGSQILTDDGDGFEAVDVEDDDTYEEDIYTTDEDTDTGTYTTVVVSAGRDGEYGDGDLGAGPGDLADLWDFSGKTASQILSLIESDLWGAAGSDDQYFILTFKIESAWIALDPIEDVGVGDPIEVSGSTNRAGDTNILITIDGPSDLLPASVDVVDGKFNATIDTEDAETGVYVIEVDDGDGNTDTTTVTIGEAAPATPEPTEEVPTPEPTEEVPTPEPTDEEEPEPTEEPTPTPEEPGFEAVFAIGGLLAVAYLVMRIRK